MQTSRPRRDLNRETFQTGTSKNGWSRRLHQSLPCIPTRSAVERWVQQISKLMARRARDSVAPLRRNSADWIPARIERLSAGIGSRHPVTVHKASVMTRSWGECEKCSTRQECSTLLLNEPGLRWLFARLLLQHPNPARASKPPQECDAWCQLFWSDTKCRWHVSVLSNVTPSYLGAEQKGNVSLLKLTFGS